jgi:hypothetical protein
MIYFLIFVISAAVGAMISNHASHSIRPGWWIGLIVGVVINLVIVAVKTGADVGDMIGSIFEIFD